MPSDDFWRRHDMLMRLYDWGDRLGLNGFVLSGLVALVIAIWAYMRDLDPLTIFLVMLCSFASVALVYLAFVHFWDRRPAKAKVQPIGPALVESPNPLAENIPNLRVADDSAVISLFEGEEADRFRPLLEGDRISSWARPMDHGEPPLRQLAGAQWKTLSFWFAPKQHEQTRNQTFLKTFDGHTFYYDLYLNRIQMERAWPLISEIWRPTFIAIRYLSEKLGDKDERNCFPLARRELRQAAYNKRVQLRGRKQLADKGVFKEGDYSDIHTDINSDYWINSEINALATSSQAQTHYHTDPQTAFAWGPKGLGERNRYAELLVSWPDVLREWPK
jgi:hypothetical protein